ncbi:substrate-binding domain-containing protein [Streptomyces niveus]
MARLPWFTSVLIAVFVMVGTGFAAKGQPDREQLDAFARVLLLAGPALLLLRHRYPVLCVFGVCLSAVLYLGAGYPYGPIFLTVAVACFAAIVSGHRQAAWWAIGLPWVDLDWEAAVALALRETVAAGHRHIVFLSSADHEIASRRGYALRGLAGARLAARENTADIRVVPSSGEPGKLVRALREALAARPAPTALVVQHLILLPHLLDEITVAGLRVPEDLAVVLVGSFPDHPAGRPLPRIELPVTEMSAAVVRLALGAADTDRAVLSGEHPSHRLITPRMATGSVIRPPSEPSS